MNDNDIDALLKELRGHAANGYKTCQYFALTLLVAERDALQKQRDEAHGLIRKWRLNLVDVVEVGDYMDAMTSDARIGMNDADKRAFLEATRKEGGGA